jgi:DNA polymerase III subunit chi
VAQPHIEFHTAVADPIGFACRLLRKAYRQGARVVVLAPGDTLATLDRALWTFEEREFVPHLRLGAGETTSASLALTPIWLSSGALPDAAPPVLVNLGADVEPVVLRFERVIEVVASNEAWAGEARARWRRYRDAGYAITHHAASAS